MKSVLVALLLVASGTARAEAPNAAALAATALERLRASMKAADDYTYDVTQVDEKLDGHGGIRERKTRDYEIFFVDGRPIQRPVAENGIRFDNTRQAREDAVVTKRVREARREGRQEREDDDAAGLAAALGRFDFREVARELLDGRPAIVLEGTAQPGKRKVEADGVLRKLAGRLWVDEADSHLAQIEVHNTGSIRLGWGLLASVSAVEMRFRFTRVAPELWLPARVETTAVGRLLLFKGFRQRTTRAYSGYRRFGVESDERLEPIPPGPGDAALSTGPPQPDAVPPRPSRPAAG